MQIPTSLRRHYPDQVPGVEAIRLLSANGVQLPQRVLDYSYHFRISMSKEDQVRGFTPLGMLEYWNIGKMGLEIQKYWTTGPPKV